MPAQTTRSSISDLLHATLSAHPESAISDLALHEEVSQTLVGNVDPERLESYRFAQGILPVFDLIRALFSQSPLDTCLKLMLLHELSRAGGRSTARSGVLVSPLPARQDDWDRQRLRTIAPLNGFYGVISTV